MDSATGVVHSRLLRSGVPLGGIGAGTFQFRTDGTVGQAGIEDDPNRRRSEAPGCFVALWTRADARTTARVLALRSAYGLPTVTKLDYDGLYPQANLLFPDVANPVQATLLAFSPLVPFDLKNSSFPAVAFILRLKNTTALPVEVSGLVSWESMLNDRDTNAHSARIFPSAQGFFRAHLGGVDDLPVSPAPVAAGPGSSTPPTPAAPLFAPAAPTQPQMTLTAFPQRAQAAVSVALWDAQAARPDWWDAWARDGSVPDGKPGQTAQFARPAACVTARLTLKPGESVELPFAVSWYMPPPPAPTKAAAQTNTSSTLNRLPSTGASERPGDAGHYYQVAFDNADDAAMQLLEDWRSLYALTEEWQKRLLFSNMPRWMARRMINAAAPLSTHAVHTRDGRFALLDVIGNDASDGKADALGTTAQGNAPAAPASQPAPDAYLSERDATFSHQCADALLLALFPQLAAQELTQFTAMQDAGGFVVPPAGADWAARLGPPLTPGGPLIPNASGLFVLPDLSRPAKSTPDGANQPGGAQPSSGKSRSRGKAQTTPLQNAGKTASQNANKPASMENTPAPAVLPVAALDPLDATSAYVGQAARFLLWTGDPDDIKRFYPGVRRAVAALLSSTSPTTSAGAAGSPLVSQPASLTLRLAALRAGQKIAQLAGDTGFAAQCERAAQQGRTDIEARYWNGEFYQDMPRHAPTPDRDKKDAPLIPAPDALCGADQLWGQWLAYQLDLGPLLPPDHLLKAAQSLQRRNDQAGDVPPPTTPPFSLLPQVGALLPPCQVRTDSKPLASGPAACLLPASLLADASLNIWQDQPEIGVALLRRLETGRDDLLRSPWQYPARVAAAGAGGGEEEIRRQGDRETGKQGEEGTPNVGGAGERNLNTPAASLAATADWNLLYALLGFALDMHSSQMTLAPNIPGTWRTFAAPIFAPTFWGSMEYRPTAHGGITSFRLDRLIGFVTTPRTALLRNRAELTLKSLRVLGPPRLENNQNNGISVVPTKFEAYVSVGQRPIGCRATQSADGYITLAFDTPLTMTAGDRLEVDVH